MSSDLPVTEEYKMQQKMKTCLLEILTKRGLKRVEDVQISSDGAFYYMTVTEEKLEIHKVVFDDYEQLHPEKPAEQGADAEAKQH